MSTLGVPSGVPHAGPPLAAGVVGRPRAVDPALAKVAGEVEGMFLREMLSAWAKSAVKGSSTHAGMVTDALTSAVASAGGIGLCRMLEDALARPGPGSTGEAVKGSGGAAVRGARS